MLGCTRSEFECLKNRARIPVFTKIGPEFKCKKDKIRVPMFRKIGPEFQCLQN